MICEVEYMKEEKLHLNLIGTFEVLELGEHLAYRLSANSSDC